MEIPTPPAPPPAAAPDPAPPPSAKPLDAPPAATAVIEGGKTEREF